MMQDIGVPLVGERLEVLDKAEVQIFEYYSNDLKSFTSEWWEDQWKAWEAIQGASSAASAAALQEVAGSPEHRTRPPFLVNWFEKIRFVKESGKKAVVLPTQMIAWGPDRDIASGSPYARLQSKIFARVFADLTDTEIVGSAAATVRVAPRGSNGEASSGKKKGAKKGSDVPKTASTTKKPVSKKTTPANTRAPRKKKSTYKGESDEEESEESEESEEESEESDSSVDEEAPLNLVRDDFCKIETIVREEKEGNVLWCLVKWNGYPIDDSPASPSWFKRSKLKKVAPVVLAAFDATQSVPAVQPAAPSRHSARKRNSQGILSRGAAAASVSSTGKSAATAASSAAPEDSESNKRQRRAGS
jgi:hypothetical protein